MRTGLDVLGRTSVHGVMTLEVTTHEPMLSWDTRRDRLGRRSRYGTRAIAGLEPPEGRKQVVAAEAKSGQMVRIVGGVQSTSAT